MLSDTVIAIPTLNESKTIADLLAFFLRDAEGAQIVVVDGLSTDGTADIVRSVAVMNKNVHLITNPLQRQAAGLNAVARWATARNKRYLIRADAHASYPNGFCRMIIDALDHEGTESVVVPLHAEASIGWQHANAVLQSSWLGHGGAPHRRSPSQSGYVQHGHHAAFRLRAFVALDGYDSRFAAAEDVEFDHRLTASGGKIFLCARAAVRYLPRASPCLAAAQFFRNGYWRSQVWRKHAIRPRLRQTLPLLATLLWLGSTLAGVVWPFAALPAAAYFVLVATLSLRAAKGHLGPTWRVAVLALLSQSAFSLGILTGFFQTARGPTGKPVPA